jgi:hypothetical protein
MSKARANLARTCPVVGIFFYLLLTCGAMLQAEALELVGFDLSNQLEFSQNTEDDEETLENWLDVNYRLDLLTTGLRYEAFQPSKSGQRKEEISFVYFMVEKDGIGIRGGDFYAIFGRGLTLRSYEDRDLRVDNKLTGVKLQGYYRGLETTLLAGRPPRKDRNSAEELRGLDMNFQPAQGLSFGWSYVALEAPSVAGKGAEISSVRMDAYPEPFNFYGELAKRTGHLGYGLYLSSSLALSGFAITAEVKDYDRISLRTSDGLDYNTPPALTREHTYSLFRRHPHTLDADNEVGVQVEASISPQEGTSLLLNYSYTAQHLRYEYSVQASPGVFGEYGRYSFREAYLEIAQDMGERISLVAAGGKSQLAEATIHTGVLDLSLYLDALKSLRFEMQGQHVEEHGEYDDQQLTVEFTRAPRLSLSLVGERTNKSDIQKVPGEANNWLAVQMDLQLTENHDATLFLGSRQGGFICTGGRCRWEPEFEGIELKLFSHF